MSRGCHCKRGPLYLHYLSRALRFREKELKDEEEKKKTDVDNGDGKGEFTGPPVKAGDKQAEV